MPPRARRTDPTTSHEAASSVTKQAQRQSQRAVYRVIRDHGPMSDTTLCWQYRNYSIVQNEEFPTQSDSGLRTRRSELVEQGWVYDTGVKEKLRSGRKSILWGVRTKEQREQWKEEARSSGEQDSLFADDTPRRTPGFYDTE